MSHSSIKLFLLYSSLVLQISLPARAQQELPSQPAPAEGEEATSSTATPPTAPEANPLFEVPVAPVPTPDATSDNPLDNTGAPGATADSDEELSTVGPAITEEPEILAPAPAPLAEVLESKPLELSAEATFSVLTHQFPTAERGLLEMEMADLSVLGRLRLPDEISVHAELQYQRLPFSPRYELGFRQFAVVLPISESHRFQLGLQLHPWLEDLESSWDQPYLQNEGLPLLFRYRYLQANDVAVRYSVDVLGRWLFYLGSGKRFGEEAQNFSKEALALWRLPFSDVFQLQLGYSRQLFTEPEWEFRPSERTLARLLLQTQSWFWSLESGVLRDDGQRILNERMADEINNPALGGAIVNGRWTEMFLRAKFEESSVGLRLFHLKPFSEANLDVAGAGLIYDRQLSHGHWGLSYNYSQRSEDHSLQSGQEDEITLYLTLAGDKLINL